MNLLSVEEIVDFLDEEYQIILKSDPELANELENIRLTKISITNRKLNNFIENMNFRNLPRDFLDLISKYNFGNFSIRNVQFGHTGNYFNELIDNNSREKYWFNELADQNAILIGFGDPYSIMLNLNNSAVTVTSSEIQISKQLQIAPSFTRFIQGLGTAHQAVITSDIEDFLILARTEFGMAALDFWSAQV